MRNFPLLSSVIKNKENSSLVLENINIIRFLFYILSATILIKLGMQNTYADLSSEIDLLDSILYFFIGIVAATIANSTGAGGGIVFLPIFIGLGLSPAESLSTSITIQCFGMSSGALTWISYSKKEKVEYSRQWEYFYFIFPVSSLSACIGLFIAQVLMPHPPLDIELFFAIFSLLVGIIILLRTLKVKKEYKGRTHALSKLEVTGLILLSFIGGSITNWLSIGIGEILLIYLILLGFRLNFAVASAVCVSAISVLFALPHHIFSNFISYEILTYAAPGALIGGILARTLATHLGAHKLKIATSVWIILSAIPYLILSIK